MALTDDVFNQAAQAQEAPGKTVGNAVEAYNLSTQTQAARADLEAKKQANEMGKAHAFLGMMDSMARMSPEMQKLSVKSIGNNLRNMFPDMDPSFVEALSKDKDFRATVTQSAATQLGRIRNGEQMSLDGAMAINSVPGMNAKDALDTATKAQEDYMKKKTAEAAANIKVSSLEERRNKSASAAGKDFEDNGILKQSKTNLNSLTRSVNILENMNKPLSTKDFNLAYTDYINAVAAGGAATEGKIGRELPATFETELNDWKQKFGTDADLRASKEGRRLISLLQENIRTVKHDLGDAVEEQAYNTYMNYSQSSNPKTLATAKEKLRIYAPKKYNAMFGGGKALASDEATAPAGPAAVSSPSGAAPAAGSGPLDFQSWVAAGKPVGK